MGSEVAVRLGKGVGNSVAVVGNSVAVSVGVGATVGVDVGVGLGRWGVFVTIGCGVELGSRGAGKNSRRVSTLGLSSTGRETFNPKGSTI